MTNSCKSGPEILWNPYADQPHNIASREERFRRHFQYAEGYLRLLWTNWMKAGPVLSRYFHYRRELFERPVKFSFPLGAAVSPESGRWERILSSLSESGARQILVRIPSWEKNKFSVYRDFLSRLEDNGMKVVLSLLQCRKDVENPDKWRRFLNLVFERFGGCCRYFEIGHAWNRTKWGVWDYREYLKLAREAAAASRAFNVKIVGPAVIDFEFHLFPPVMDQIDFDKISSLLYVDRVGAPENRQFGWNALQKSVLLKAVADGCSRLPKKVWITEFNWPLLGTGKYSPAAGKPNVSETEQADYFVRYVVPVLCSGLVERMYWWQLAAPGYGLIDPRGGGWRERPAFSAFKTLMHLLPGSEFYERLSRGPVHLFRFRRNSGEWIIAWSKSTASAIEFDQKPDRILDRDGGSLSLPSHPRIMISGRPVYLFFNHPVKVKGQS
jgi:hypothetical protein